MANHVPYVGDERDALNESHATDPQRGDYWHEMFCPILVVLGRLGKRVVICDKTKATDDQHWAWDFDNGVKMLTLAEFSAKVRYDTNPRFYCDVAPRLHIGAADHFAQAA